MFFYTAAEIFRCRGFSDSRERAHLVCRIWNIIRREERELLRFNNTCNSVCRFDALEKYNLLNLNEAICQAFYFFWCFRSQECFRKLLSKYLINIAEWKALSEYSSTILNSLLRKLFRGNFLRTYCETNFPQLETLRKNDGSERCWWCLCQRKKIVSQKEYSTKERVCEVRRRKTKKKHAKFL